MSFKAFSLFLKVNVRKSVMRSLERGLSSVY